MVMVKLLGRPAVLADGVELEGPRGKKSWGLLAYLAGTGAAIPREVLDEIEPLQDDKDAVRTKGIELATQLCRDVLAGGAPGLHFITLNRSKATREIFEALRADGLV